MPERYTGGPHREALLKVETILASFYSEYQQLVAEYNVDISRLQDTVYANDEDGYAFITDRETEFKNDREQLGLSVSRALAAAFPSVAKMQWQETKEASTDAEARISIYHLPLEHGYRLRLYRSLSYPLSTGGKTYNEERWNLSIERWNVPANDAVEHTDNTDVVSADDFPLSFRINFGTLTSEKTIHDLTPDGLLKGLPKKQFEAAIAAFKQAHKL